ncbi:hypothetical protein TP70_05450 [Staphylococcus microti]|uniref:Uncharacterized protein n=1 Tax=Staphylococcus microti TaxID=569857 RepID=A0ABR5C882_9STAP|nr:hypothetical protein TP70_05450 [Staphylococcus microti]PNZ83795.1 hypothetical protein CD132_01700 [Staphylococcus microti]
MKMVTSYWFSLFIALMFVSFSTPMTAFTSINSIGHGMVFVSIFVIKVVVLFIIYKVAATLIVKALT